MLAVFKIARQLFKLTKAGHEIVSAHHEKHGRAYKVFYHVSTAVYVLHIVAQIASGLKVESVTTGAAATVELVAHLAE